MSLTKNYNNLKSDWEVKLQRNEWLFSDFRESVVKSLMPHEAFAVIPEAVDLLLNENDIHLIGELFMLLFDIVYKSDTTERHPALIAHWENIITKVSSIEDYYRRQTDEFKKWFRIP
ncbi:MAG: hypothetical protein PHQ23_04485 [Candidatus Wallbacteria bacterium]|nr:hypothetical protein [Candidatus Wallbacteria bacterium]